MMNIFFLFSFTVHFLKSKVNCKISSKASSTSNDLSLFYTFASLFFYVPAHFTVFLHFFFLIFKTKGAAAMSCHLAVSSPLCFHCWEMLE